MNFPSERVELLEKKVANLEKLVANMISKEIVTVTNNSPGYADIYQYKNSLLLVSRSKDLSTYAIKDYLKNIGAKWANVKDKCGNKFSGWMILGSCKEVDMDIAINSLIDKLKKNSIKLEYENKGQILHFDSSITTNSDP